jgi:hypothetical protein
MPPQRHSEDVHLGICQPVEELRQKFGKGWWPVWDDWRRRFAGTWQINPDRFSAFAERVHEGLQQFEARAYAIEQQKRPPLAISRPDRDAQPLPVDIQVLHLRSEFRHHDQRPNT